MILALLVATVTFLSDCKATFNGCFNFHADRANALTVQTTGGHDQIQGFVIWKPQAHGVTQYLIFPWSAVELAGTSTVSYMDIDHPAPNAGADITGTGYMVLWDGEVEVAGQRYKADQFNPKVYPPLKITL